AQLLPDFPVGSPPRRLAFRLLAACTRPREPRPCLELGYEGGELPVVPHTRAVWRREAEQPDGKPQREPGEEQNRRAGRERRGAVRADLPKRPEWHCSRPDVQGHGDEGGDDRR